MGRPLDAAERGCRFIWGVSGLLGARARGLREAQGEEGGAGVQPPLFAEVRVCVAARVRMCVCMRACAFVCVGVCAHARACACVRACPCTRAAPWALWAALPPRPCPAPTQAWTFSACMSLISHLVAAATRAPLEPDALDPSSRGEAGAEGGSGSVPPVAAVVAPGSTDVDPRGGEGEKRAGCWCGAGLPSESAVTGFLPNTASGPSTGAHTWRGARCHGCLGPPTKAHALPRPAHAGAGPPPPLQLHDWQLGMSLPEGLTPPHIDHSMLGAAALQRTWQHAAAGAQAPGLHSRWGAGRNGLPRALPSTRAPPRGCARGMLHAC